jgi:large subunit ribosomal protein L22
MARRIAPEAQEAMATARFIRISPTKARQMVDMIRGRHVEDARRVLRFTSRGPSTTVGKVLESAVANAEHNRGLPGDELVVARAWVDEGPTLKRFRPRALGRATRVRKRTCHISVVVGRAPEADLALPERPATKQTAQRVRKDTAGKPARKPSASQASQATEAGPETTSETAAGRTRKKSTPKRTTAKKTAASRAAEKTTENDKEGR